MANKRKIGAIIALDGEKEFRQSVTSCNKALTAMRSEMKLVEAQTAGQANTLETLQSKHDVLSRTLDTAAEKEEAVRRGLEHAEDQYNKTGEELESYRRYLELAQASLKEMEESSEAADESLEKQRQIVSDLSGVVSKGEETYQKAGDRVNDWKKQLNNAQAQVISATRALNENDALLKEAEESYDGCAKSVDNFGNRVDNTAEKLISFASTLKVKVNEAIIDFGKNAISSAVDGALEMQDAEKKLAASTGATAAEMQQYNGIMEEIYSAGYGDTISDTADAMALVRQYTGEVDPTKIQQLAEGAMALDDTFSNMDMEETLRGVDSLMTNMGLSAEEAFDYIVTGAQNGLNKSGELTDNIAEYGQLWAQAGFSAEEMFTILQNGLDNGAYNLDKVNDFVKEFGISLSDGRIEENLSSFSLKTQNLFMAWQNGQATTKDVFYSVISDLSTMTNQQEALTIASNTWSSMGEDNAMAVLTSLTNLNGTYTDVKGSMESMKEVRYDSLANQYKVLGRTVQTDVIQPIAQKFLPVAQKGIKLLADNIDTIVPVAGAAGAAMGTIWVTKKASATIANLKDTAKNIKNLVTNLVTHTAATTADTAATSADAAAKGAQATATTAAATAQTGLNAAMAANPIGILIAAGAGLAVGLGALISQIDTVKTKTDELVESAEAAEEKLGDTGEALPESTGGLNQSIEDIQTSAALASSLGDELILLSKDTSRTAEEQGRMQAIVLQLNELFPDMGLAIDEATGSLNMSTDAIQDYISSAKNLAQVEAAQEKMKEVAADLVDAEMAKAEAEEKSQEISKQLQKLETQRAAVMELQQIKAEKAEQAQKDYNEALESGEGDLNALYDAAQDTSDAMVTYEGQTMTASEALEKMQQDAEELTNAQESLNGSIAEQEEEIGTAEESIGKYTDYIGDLTGANQDAAAAARDQAAAQGEQAAAAQASITTAGQELEAFRGLSAEQQNLAVNVTNAVLEMQGTVQEYLSQSGQMFQEFTDVTTVNTTDLLNNMQSQVDGVKQWEENISSLMETTKTTADGTMVALDEGLVQYLANMGPEGAAYAQAFVNMTGDEMQKANELWSEKLNIENFTNTEGQSLTQGIGELAAGGEEAFANLAESLGAQAEDSGRYVVQGLVDGMVAAQGEAETAGEDLGVKTIDSVNAGLGTHSPSTKTKQSGRDVGTGLSIGIEQGKSGVMTQGRLLGSAVVTSINAGINLETIRGFGYNAATALAGGIREGKSEAISAAEELATDTITAAKEKLEINSPSHVFERFGAGTIEGYVKGVDENAKAARKSITSALDFRGMDFSGLERRRSEPALDYNLLVAAFKTALKEMSLTIKVGNREVGRALNDLGVQRYGRA